MKQLIFLLSLLFLTYESYSQDFDVNKLDSLISKIEKFDKGMGCLSIFHNGKEIYHRAYGFENIEKRIHATEKTKYCIGSITKTFTAVIIMQLIEENKLSLDTKLSNFFPEIPNSEAISIEQLLRHRSGLFNYTNSPDFHSWNDTIRTKSEILEKFIKNGNVFKPNEKSQYCNTNYVLLSFIAQQIEKKDYSEILAERITKPLKLNSTYFGNNPETENNEALPHFKYETWEMRSNSNLIIYDGAGAIVSNPTELNIFFNALFKGELVSDKSLNKMITIIDDYGIGMYEMPFYERTSIGHAGDVNGFQSVSEYFPEDSMIFSFISNGTGMDRNELLTGVLSIYFGKEYDIPEFSTYKVNSDDLNQYVGTYSSPDSPFKLTISKDRNILLCQATGQGAFPLEAFDKNKFRFTQAALEIEFFPDEEKLILIQGGEEVFYKEK